MRVLIPAALTIFLISSSPPPIYGNDIDFDPGTDVLLPQPSKGPLPPVSNPCEKLTNYVVAIPDPAMICGQLTGYEIGQPTHKNRSKFVMDLFKEINDRIESGYEVSEIAITGFADGIPNNGLKIDLSHLPEICKSKDINSSRINDLELARLRGCIISTDLRKLTELNSFGGVNVNEFDEPDGGKQGIAYRKVFVKVSLRRKQNVTE